MAEEEQVVSVTLETDELGATIVKGRLPATRVDLSVRTLPEGDRGTSASCAEVLDVELHEGQNDLGQIVLAPE